MFCFMQCVAGKYPESFHVHGRSCQLPARQPSFQVHGSSFEIATLQAAPVQFHRRCPGLNTLSGVFPFRGALKLFALGREASQDEGCHEPHV